MWKDQIRNKHLICFSELQPSNWNRQDIADKTRIVVTYLALTLSLHRCQVSSVKGVLKWKWDTGTLLKQTSEFLNIGSLQSNMY